MDRDRGEGGDGRGRRLLRPFALPCRVRIVSLTTASVGFRRGKARAFALRKPTLTPRGEGSDARTPLPRSRIAALLPPRSSSPLALADAGAAAEPRRRRLRRRPARRAAAPRQRATHEKPC